MAAASPQMNSTGSSFAGVAIQQWVGQAATLDGLNINWQVSNSVQGLDDFAQNQIDFAASDIPYSSGQASSDPTVPYQYLPTWPVRWPSCTTSPGSDGQQIRSLVLNDKTLEDIFSGRVKTGTTPRSPPCRRHMCRLPARHEDLADLPVGRIGRELPLSPPTSSRWTLPDSRRTRVPCSSPSASPRPPGRRFPEGSRHRPDTRDGPTAISMVRTVPTTPPTTCPPRRATALSRMSRRPTPRNTTCRWRL